MKQRIKLGIVCLARKTFDYNAAKEIYDKRKEDLKKLENVDLEIIDELVIEVEDAEKAAKELASKDLDGLVIISGTFHLGHLALILDKIVRKPILLWAFKELPYNGGKIRLNSVCGVNLNASNLYKSGNDTFIVNIGDSIDEDWVDAIRIKTAIEKAHLGIAGYRAHGFFNLDIDELRIFKEMGILVDQYPISQLYGQSVTEDEIKVKEAKIRNKFDVSGVTDEQVKKVAKLMASAQKFIDNNSLTGLAVRCWPEFANEYGISPCAAMSILQSEDYILGCEGDLEGTLTMIAARAVGAETPFLADLSQVNFEDNFALMWHCGVAPCNLWDGKCVRSLDTYFAGGRGVTADFVMKSGDINIFRIDSARGKTRLYMASGKAIPMEKELRGTYAKVKFDKHIKDVVDQVVYKGIAHHVAMVYGDFIKPFEIFARLMGWEVIK